MSSCCFWFRVRGRRAAVVAGFLFASLIALLPLPARAQDDADTEEVIALSPFSVSSENDSAYGVSSAFARERFATNLLEPERPDRTPNVPVTLTRRADALAVSFTLVNLGDKQDQRNAELYRSIESLRAQIASAPGLRLEHREVRFAAGNRSKISISRASGSTTSYASILILAELPAGVDVVERVKTIRDTVARATLAGATRLVDGVVGLYLKNPAQHRAALLDDIFADLDALKRRLGPDFEVLPSGFNLPIRARICSETDVELWIDYSFTIRSVRELTAPKR